MFITSNLDEIVLLDFGVSKISKENLSTSIYGFSYRYSSPEVSIGKAIITSKSDMFSFGMFFLLIILNKYYYLVFYMKLLLVNKLGEKKLRHKFIN